MKTMNRILLSTMIFSVVLLTASCEDDEITAPKDTFVTDNYAAADIRNGGLLYDKWWKITSGTEPTVDHLLWSTQTTNARSGADTWRCKECHGWDKQGVSGAYGSGSHMTGFDGVWIARNKDKQVIFDAMKNTTGNHDFSDELTDLQILDLTKLIVDGLIDYSTHINLTTKAANGNATSGSSLYSTNCSACHGADGTTLNFGSVDDPVYVGTLSNDNPWETLHKIRFGHPGSAMPSMVENGLTTTEQVDILKFAQTLP